MNAAEFVDIDDDTPAFNEWVDSCEYILSCDTNDHPLKKIGIRGNSKRVSDVVTIWNPFRVSEKRFPGHWKSIGNQI